MLGKEGEERGAHVEVVSAFVFCTKKSRSAHENAKEDA